MHNDDNQTDYKAKAKERARAARKAAYEKQKERQKAILKERREAQKKDPAYQAKVAARKAEQRERYQALKGAQKDTERKQAKLDRDAKFNSPAALEERQLKDKALLATLIPASKLQTPDTSTEPKKPVRHLRLVTE